MLYDWTSTAALGVVRDIQPKEPLTLTGEGLWVCLISSGRCTASLTDASPSPAGSALILPPQSAAAGHLVLSRAPLTLTPEGESHLLCIQLTGQAAVQFLAGLTELPFLARHLPPVEEGEFLLYIMLKNVTGSMERTLSTGT